MPCRSPSWGTLWQLCPDCKRNADRFFRTRFLTPPEAPPVLLSGIAGDAYWAVLNNSRIASLQVRLELQQRAQEMPTT